MKEHDASPRGRTFLNRHFRLAMAGTALALTLGASAQEIFNETFTGGASTTGFTVTQAAGTCTWTFDNPGSRDISGAGFDADFAIFDSDNCGSGADSSAADLTSAPFDASASGNYILSFDQQYREIAPTVANVQVWDGSQWTVVYSADGSNVGYPNPAVNQSINITSATGGSTTAQVRFHFGGDWRWWWALDNINLQVVQCAAPGNLAVSNVTTSGATLSWTDNGSAGYQWAVTTGDIPDGTNEVATGDGTDMNVSGLASGTPYTAFVRADCGDGSFSVWSNGVAFATGITNDDCSGAIALTVNPDLNCVNTTPGTVAGATDSGITSTCSGTADDDVWFSFTATDTAHVISLNDIAGSTDDMYMALWTGDCGSLTLVPESCSDPEEMTVSGLTIGTTYYLQVYTWTDEPGQTSTFNVCVGTLPPPPANDDCAGALALTVNPNFNCGVVTPGTVASATPSNVASTCDGTADDDVWFTFTATDTMHTISLNDITGSTEDMYMALWTGDCGSLTLVPESCSDPEEMTVGGLTIGTTYYLQVYTWTSAPNQTSSFNVCVGTEPACQPPTEIEVDSLAAPNATITWANNGAMEYQWELRLIGAAGSGPTGLVDGGVVTDTTLSLTNLVPDSLYTLYVRSICSVGDTSSWSDGTEILDGYCRSMFQDVDYEYISNVLYAGIDNTSDGTAGEPVDYTDQVAMVQRGGTDTLKVTILADASEYVYAFIDWNQNKVLDDAGEVYTVAANVDQNGPFDLGITVPMDAALGQTRMRVMVDYNNDIPDPCVIDSYGEAEDYTVQVDIGSGIQEVGADNLGLVPNPAHDRIALVNPEGKATQAMIYDLVGNLVMKTNHVASINVAGLAPGTYIMKAQDANGNSLAHLRFVKQ